jgi:prepilin-type N-terminal cleavage/methylation domain-containing protein
MKMKTEMPVAEQLGGAVSPLTAVVAHGVTRPTRSVASSQSKTATGFTLVELLVVIAIIGVLAGFTLPVLDAIKRKQMISHTRAEMGVIEAAINRYHDAYGFYPPDNHNTPPNYAINQLYYELMGVTNNGTGVNASFLTLDGRSKIFSNEALATFGVPGFVNCNKSGSGEDAARAKSFLVDVRPNQIGTNGTSPANILYLDASVGGPDEDYAPPGVSGLNPWRYNSSNPTHNPGAYELWVQLVINGKTNLVCNWNKEVQINNPLP